MWILTIFSIIAFSSCHNALATQGDFSDEEQSSQTSISSTPPTQPFTGLEELQRKADELKQALDLYEKKFSLKRGFRPQPNESHKKALEKELGISFPEDLWQFYSRFWNRPFQGFELYNIWIDSPACIVKYNKDFHEISGKPKDHIAFADEGRGEDYYVIDGDGLIHYWCPDTDQYSEKLTDQWPSFAAWLTEKIKFVTE